MKKMRFHLLLAIDARKNGLLQKRNYIAHTDILRKISKEGRLPTFHNLFIMISVEV